MEEADAGYKDKVMQQNQQDGKKAATVKQQKKVLEAVVGQRMAMQKVLTKINMFPQLDAFAEFRQKKQSQVEQVVGSLKQSLMGLNEV